MPLIHIIFSEAKEAKSFDSTHKWYLYYLERSCSCREVPIFVLGDNVIVDYVAYL